MKTQSVRSFPTTWAELREHWATVHEYDPETIEMWDEDLAAGDRSEAMALWQHNRFEHALASGGIDHDHEAEAQSA